MTNGKNKRNRILARIAGNFGTAFFGPLLSGNAAEAIYEIGLSFEQILVISVLSATFTVGLMLSREVTEYGKNQSL